MIADLLEQTCFIHRKYFQYVKMIKWWKIYLTYYERMGWEYYSWKSDICKVATNQRMFGVFAIDESPFAASQFLSHADWMYQRDSISIFQMVILESNIFPSVNSLQALCMGPEDGICSHSLHCSLHPGVRKVNHYFSQEEKGKILFYFRLTWISK